ncbi:peptidylprolyl isomerase [Shewanella sedimentimangrovi]|uniref:peptidylprolyl isomerase n=1 Tax=Shewanella sedimentimangrovi TaxID=2814293 RepID=A0ABX7R4F9_9GAMM|nr:peptidyl-prolyl cis-trans isomerase [Shewanella sedimentimangrovi]QSX37700.1 peptidyl-prolyl cis-trans isomerase [Shewanella sedimentimangrovi]
MGIAGRFIIPWLLAVLAPVVMAEEPSKVPQLPPSYTQVYARIDGNPELLVSFQDFYQYKRRNKYYHSQPPEAEYASFLDAVKREWLEQIVLQNYLQQQKPDFQVDNNEVDAQVIRFDEQMQNNPDWPVVKDAYLKVYRQRLIRDLLYRAYKDEFEKSVTVSEEEARHFYEQHPEKFTQPPRNRVSLILMAVDPSAGAEAWNSTRKQLEQVRFRIVNGEDFAEMAREFSTDPSAENGGDMGFVHKGSISNIADEALSKIAPGEMTPVLMLLNGMALFRLDERLPEQHHSFDEVKQRAAGLALQEKSVASWEKFITELTQRAKVEILSQD